jgi:hypothetical protein
MRLVPERRRAVAAGARGDEDLDTVEEHRGDSIEARRAGRSARTREAPDGTYR